MSNVTKQPESLKSTALNPQVLKMLEDLRTQWVVPDLDEVSADVDEQHNEHTDLTLANLSLKDSASSLPATYSGVSRRTIRKTNYVPADRYVRQDFTTVIRFGDLLSVPVFEQYVDQGAKSFTIADLEVSIFASPLAQASTGYNGITLITEDGTPHYTMVPIHSASNIEVSLDTIVRVSDPDARRTPLVTVKVSQQSLRRIFTPRQPSNLDAGFDLAVYFTVSANGIPGQVQRVRGSAALMNSSFRW